MVIDTDPGVDDLVALALAARSPEVDLVAVTTSYGNASLSATTRNARELLRLAGRPDVPVLPGAAAPLRRRARTAPVRHGPQGAGDAPVPPSRRVLPGPRVLRQVLAAQAEPVTLVTMGPLTNLAAALSVAGPGRGRVVRHVGMFGAARTGAAHGRLADFNAWCDPEAAARVIRADVGTLMVPLDVGRRVIVGPKVVERAMRSADPLTAWLGAALACALRHDRAHRGLDGVLVHDVLTVAAVLDPQVVVVETLPIQVSLDAGRARGHTRVRPGATLTAVAVDVHVPRIAELLARVLPA